MVFLVFSKKKKKKLNTLVFQSTGIGLSTYHCNWYDLPSRRAVLLMIVIRRANVSFQITAGKFSPFSLEFFNAVSGKKKKKKKFFRFFENFKSSISINVFHSGIENIRWISFRVTGHERQAGRGKITRNDLLLLVSIR